MKVKKKGIRYNFNHQDQIQITNLNLEASAEFTHLYDMSNTNLQNPMLNTRTHRQFMKHLNKFVDHTITDYSMEMSGEKLVYIPKKMTSSWKVFSMLN